MESGVAVDGSTSVSLLTVCDLSSTPLDVQIGHYRSRLLKPPTGLHPVFRPAEFNCRDGAIRVVDA